MRISFRLLVEGPQGKLTLYRITLNWFLVEWFAGVWSGFVWMRVGSYCWLV